MRAAYYEKNGPAAEVLHIGEVETPTPGPGEVRVRLKTSGINPSDVKGRAGLTRKIAFPRVIPHSDGAGEIDMIGPGVPPARKGERVWTFHAAWKRPSGTAAEYVVLPAAQAVPLPANTSFEAGAGLAIPAMTAWYAVSLAGAGDGATVFVPGGAGAVGHYAIQFAKAHGARVITTVSSPAKAEVARKAGADHVIDYRREDVAARMMEITANRRVDAVIEVELGVNAKLYPAILRPRGTVIVYGTGAEATLPAAFCLTNNITIRFILVYEMTENEIARALADITAMLKAGRLVHNVAKSYPLNDIIVAHEALESGTMIGKVILTVG